MWGVPLFGSCFYESDGVKIDVLHLITSVRLKYEGDSLKNRVRGGIP